MRLLCQELVFVTAAREFLGRKCENRETKVALGGGEWLFGMQNEHNMDRPFFHKNDILKQKETGGRLIRNLYQRACVQEWYFLSSCYKFILVIVPNM
jgi:hypothetical protein